MTKTFVAAIVGGDSVEATVTFEKESVRKIQWKVVGRLALYAAVDQLKPQMLVQKTKLPIPQGKEPEQLLLRELLLKIRGEWGDELSDPELCHCRKIPQINVERAIILGAHTIEKVRARSSANTSCGTCLPEVDALFKKYGIVGTPSS
jgi:NAD(P)H-nitrite reductase large subunit